MNGADSYEKFQENIGDDVSKIDEEIIEIIASPTKKKYSVKLIAPLKGCGAITF